MLIKSISKTTRFAAPNWLPADSVFRTNPALEFPIMSNPTPEIVSQPQRLAILQHGGFSTRHGKTGLSLLRYRGAEVVAVIDRETAGRSLREVSKMPDVPDIKVVASAEEALASKPTALAIGIVMHRHSLGAQAALSRLETQARQEGRHVEDLLIDFVTRFANTGALIGTDLASDLGVTVGDKLRVTSATGRSETLDITGLFDMGNRELNRRWVFVTLKLAQTLLDLPGGSYTVPLGVDTPTELETARRMLRKA